MATKNKGELVITTKALQTRHPEVYQKFFTDHDFVCSVPQILTRGYTASRRVNSQVHMKQKMPTRMYVGVTRTKSLSIEIDEWLLYDSFSDEFSNNSIEKIYSPSTIDKIYDLLKTYIDKAAILHSGIKISILSEFKRGLGFGFSGSFASCLAVTIQRIHGDLKLHEIKNKSTLSDLIKISICIDLEIFHPDDKDSISGLMPLVSYKCGSFPILQLGKKSYAHNSRSEIYLANNIVQIDTKDIAGFSEIESLSFDYGLISTKLPQYAKRLKRRYKKESLNQTRIFFNNLLQGYEGAKELPKTSNMDDFWQILYEKILQSFIMLLDSGEKSRLNAFMNTIYNAGLIYSLVEKEKEYLMKFYDLFDENKKNISEKIALLPTSCSGSQGTFLIIVKKGESRDTIKNVIGALQSQGNTYVHLKYASWRDGCSQRGLVIHQSVSNGLFSHYLPTGTLRLNYSDGRTIIDSYKRLLQKSYDGFLLDTVGKKIYFQGEKLTSAELKSQTMTVDILLMLLDRPGEDIHHSDLPISGYSKSKNEMVGKIIVPLKNYILDQCGIELSLECHGGLYDFYIRLDPKDIYLFNCIEQASTCRKHYSFLRKSSFVSKKVDA